MKQLFEQGKFKKIAIYCFIDSNLLYLLNLLDNYIEFIYSKAALCNISIHHSANGMSTVAVTGKVYEMCRENNIVMDIKPVNSLGKILYYHLI